MSNYEFALGQNDFGPLYEHSSLIQNNLMENMDDQMDIIDRQEEILNERQNTMTLPGGFSVEAAQEKESNQDAYLRI